MFAFGLWDSQITYLTIEIRGVNVPVIDRRCFFYTEAVEEPPKYYLKFVHSFWNNKGFSETLVDLTHSFPTSFVIWSVIH